MRALPNPQNLREAVQCVIESNRSDGYPPNRFVGIMENGDVQDLLSICTRLIHNDETLESLEKALRQWPTLLTLEDFVSQRGAEWGFHAATIDIARARCTYFDQVAGRTRYSAPEEIP